MRIQWQRDGVRVAALALLAACVRVATWQRTAVMFNDGPVLLGLARLMDEGEWGSVLGHPYHPLYSLATWGTWLGVGDWERAALAVSVLSGAASVAILFAFLRGAFDREVAWIGALLLAVHPYAVHFSADVQSDGLYGALFLAAVALGWRALRSARAVDAALVGGVVALAYLARPEGLGVAAVAGAFGVGRILSRRWSLARGGAWLAALCAGAGLLMAPYLVALHEQTGHWALTRKKSVVQMSGIAETVETLPGTPLPDPDVDGALLEERPFLETVMRGPRDYAPPGRTPPPPPGFWRRQVQALGLLSAVTYSTLRPELLWMLVFGLWARRRVACGPYLLALVSLYLAVLYSLALFAGYVDRRHLMPVVTLVFGWVAAGVPVFGRALLSVARRALGREGRPPAWLAAAVGAAVLVGIAAPKTFKARRVERIAHRRAAEWLAARKSEPVAAEKQRVAYYAGAPYVRFPRPEQGPVLAYLESTGARYMVVDERRLAADARLARATREGMRLVHTAEGGGQRVLVFAIGSRTAEYGGAGAPR